MCFAQHPAVKRYDFSHVKFVMSGAAPLSDDLPLAKLFPNAVVGQGYGKTRVPSSVYQRG